MLFEGRRSSRQGCKPAGESPAASVARVGCVAIPHLGAGNQPSYAWCKRPGCPVHSEELRWVQPLQWGTLLPSDLIANKGGPQITQITRIYQNMRHGGHPQKTK